MRLNIPETTWLMFSEVLRHWKHSVYCPTHAWIKPTNLAYSFWWGWKVRSQRGTLNLARREESLKSWGISSAVNTFGRGECRQLTWNLPPSLLSSWWQSHTHSSKVYWSEHSPLVLSKVDTDRAVTSRDKTHCGLPPTLQAQNKSPSSTSSRSTLRLALRQMKARPIVKSRSEEQARWQMWSMRGTEEEPDSSHYHCHPSVMVGMPPAPLIELQFCLPAYPLFDCMLLAGRGPASLISVTPA